MTVSIRNAPTAIEPPVAITLAELIDVLSQLTDDEDEIVGTMLHMVERRTVRLVAATSTTTL